MKAILSLIFVWLPVFFSIGLFSTSCKPIPPTAVVTILNENNEPIEGAEVTVRADEGRVIYLADGMTTTNVQLTNAAGQISYKFRYEAIYNVSVKTYKQSHLDKQGKGVFILKEGKTCNEIIKLR